MLADHAIKIISRQFAHSLSCSFGSTISEWKDKLLKVDFHFKNVAVSKFPEQVSLLTG